MNETLFLKRQQDILALLESEISSFNGSSLGFESLQTAYTIISSYTYANRLEKKGIITRIIIDSLTLDYGIGEKIMGFDSAIS